MASLDWKMMAIKRELSSPFFFLSNLEGYRNIYIFTKSNKKKQNEKKKE